MIIATAGHVDHGKTTLLQAITGVNADRLPEEKARGMTIDLGYAYWPQPDGRVPGFIDVPGHEKLIHNMLAGATGIDFALLVIAADEADVLSRAKSLIVAVKAPLAEVKSTQEKVLEQNADYLSRGALKQLEDRNKRELNARERSGIMEALASARTLMRDVLLTLQDEAADVVNEDVRDTIGRLAAATNVAGATRALEAVATAERNIARNVTPQLAIEVMLFDIRKALKCR